MQLEVVNLDATHNITQHKMLPSKSNSFMSTVTHKSGKTNNHKDGRHEDRLGKLRANGSVFQKWKIIKNSMDVYDKRRSNTVITQQAAGGGRKPYAMT